MYIDKISHLKEKRFTMIIVVSHTKGGVGKSTISFNLATALNSIYNIEVIDLDFQKTVTYLNEYRKNPLTVKSFDSDEDFKQYIKKDSDKRISITHVTPIKHISVFQPLEKPNSRLEYIFSPLWQSDLDLHKVASVQA